MSIYMKKLLKKDVDTTPNTQYGQFDERENPLTHYLPNFHKIPSVENIHYFLSTIFRIQDLKSSPGVFTIVCLSIHFLASILHYRARFDRPVCFDRLI